MRTAIILLGTLCILQGAWSSPAIADNAADAAAAAANKAADAANVAADAATATADDATALATGKNDKGTAVTVSIGTELSSNMNENLLKAMDNIREGTMSITVPVVKFGVDTIPSLLTSGVKTMASSVSKIADAKKKGFGKLINGVGSVVGGGAILGSSIVGGGGQILGAGIGAGANLIDAAAKFGLKLTGNLADSSALADAVMADLTNSILKGVGKGMNAAGDGFTYASKGSAKVISAVGTSISHSIGNAQDTMAKWFKTGSAKLQDGAMTLTTKAQVNYYNALQWYLNNLLTMESIMDKLTESINASSKKEGEAEGEKGSKTGGDKDSKAEGQATGEKDSTVQGEAGVTV